MPPHNSQMPVTRSSLKRSRQEQETPEETTESSALQAKANNLTQRREDLLSRLRFLSDDREELAERLAALRQELEGLDQQNVVLRENNRCMYEQLDALRAMQLERPSLPHGQGSGMGQRPRQPLGGGQYAADVSPFGLPSIQAASPRPHYHSYNGAPPPMAPAAGTSPRSEAANVHRPQAQRQYSGMHSRTGSSSFILPGMPISSTSSSIPPGAGELLQQGTGAVGGPLRSLLQHQNRASGSTVLFSQSSGLEQQMLGSSSPEELACHVTTSSSSGSPVLPDQPPQHPQHAQHAQHGLPLATKQGQQLSYTSSSKGTQLPQGMPSPVAGHWAHGPQHMAQQNSSLPDSQQPVQMLSFGTRRWRIVGPIGGPPHPARRVTPPPTAAAMGHTTSARAPPAAVATGSPSEASSWSSLRSMQQQQDQRACGLAGQALDPHSAATTPLTSATAAAGAKAPGSGWQQRLLDDAGYLMPQDALLPTADATGRLPDMRQQRSMQQLAPPPPIWTGPEHLGNPVGHARQPTGALVNHGQTQGVDCSSPQPMRQAASCSSALEEAVGLPNWEPLGCLDLDAGSAGACESGEGAGATAVDMHLGGCEAAGVLDWLSGIVDDNLLSACRDKLMSSTEEELLQGIDAAWSGLPGPANPEEGCEWVL